MSSEHSKIESGFRWAAFLPAAVAAAWIAWFAVRILNRVTMVFSGDNPDSFLSRAFIEYVSYAALGAAFVFAGAKVAPAHRKGVAYLLSVVGLVGAGFLIFPAVMIRDYWSLWSVASLVFGLAGSAYSITRGETDI